MRSLLIKFNLHLGLLSCVRGCRYPPCLLYVFSFSESPLAFRQILTSYLDLISEESGIAIQILGGPMERKGSYGVY